MRFVFTLSLLLAVGCDSGARLPPPVGASTVTVVGDTEVEFRGQGFYARLDESTPKWEIRLAGPGTPTVRFVLFTDPVTPRLYALPEDANARLILDDDDATTYGAADGTLTVFEASAERIVGRFAFTAERPDGRRVTVTGTFTAE